MQFDEFTDLVRDIVNAIPYSYDGDDFTIHNGVIIQKHKTGGAEGGNCWGNDARYFVNSDPKQDFLPLESILKKCAPDISYLKFKDIERLIEVSSDKDYEYYGNFSEYDVYKLDIEKLYNMIFAS